MKRFISLLLASLTVLTLIPLGALSVSAVNSTSKFSTPYINSKYYTQLMNAKNSMGSDKAINIAKIAESQAGYLEGIYYSDLNGYQSNGTMKLSYKSGSVYKDYNGVLDVCEYNFWYYGCSDNSDISTYRSGTNTVSGANYPVSNYNKAWCAAFVSWCAAQAGVTDLVPINAGCGHMYKAILNKGGKVVSASEIKPGDILFYACNTCNVKSHVGIVSTNTAYTIEGNSNNKVNTVQISKSSVNCMSGHATEKVFVRPAYCNHSSTYTKVTTAATCMSTGTISYYCSNCHILVKTGTLDALPHSFDQYHHCTACGKAQSVQKTTCLTGVYKTKREVYVHSTPYAVGKDGTDNSVLRLTSGKAVAVSSAVKNRDGELWYYVTYTSNFGKRTTGYIEAKHLEFFQNEFAFKLSKGEDFTVKYGEKINIPEIKREGYTLIGYKIFKATPGTSAKYYTHGNGWQASAEIAKNNYEYKIFVPDSYNRLIDTWVTADNKDTTYYKLIPIWEKTAYYTISYDANGGLYTPQSQTKEIGKSISLAYSDPVRAGYIFMGWSTSPTGSLEYYPGTAYNKDANIHLYAVWEKNPISFDEMYIKNLTSTSALLGCNVTADCSKLTEIGLMMRAEGGTMTKVASWKTGSILTYCTVQCGGANAEAPALTPGTTYYYRFYVYTTNVGVRYSDVYTFTTP